MLNRENVLVDYGCGRGRVGFFLNHQIGCRTIGVEYDETIYGQAVDNLRSYGSRSCVELFCGRAEQFCVDEADCFYFFNPFSLEVLRSVLGKILESYYGEPRTMRLFFYYPSNEYRTWLMTRPELSFRDELDFRDLFPGNDSREIVLIFEVA